METIHETLRFLHSGLRWLFVGLTLFTSAYFSIRLAARRDYDILSGRLATSYSALLAIQWVVGIVFLFTAAIPGNLAAHILMTTFAMIAAQTYFFWRRNVMPVAVRYQRLLLLIVVVSVLMLLGIAALSPDIQWRFYSNASE
ncbi:MAG: hypothetical protein SGI73_14850 [Chloroflexota bacterium]|nr:hypothetical protein [Chloroflexota bacterium]